MAHGIQTLGQLIAENSVAERRGEKPPHKLPTDPQEIENMCMNRAEVRRIAKVFFPRDIRLQVFGVWRKRRYGGVR